MGDAESFNETMTRAVEHAVIKALAKGDWITFDYGARPKIDAAMLAGIWADIDMERVKARLKERIEDMLVERICNAMATEMAGDVKQVLGVPERREAIRALAREHLTEIMRKGQA